MNFYDGEKRAEVFLSRPSGRYRLLVFCREGYEVEDILFANESDALSYLFDAYPFMEEV